MKCPFCRSTDTEVYNTRSTKFESQLWRRRRCLSCSKAFTTYESVDLGFLQVTSKNGSYEPYARYRLYAAVASAFDPKSSKTADIDALTATVESKLLDLHQDQISTNDIVITVLATLKAFDTPAFLRYLAGHAELARPSDLKRHLGGPN